MQTYTWINNLITKFRIIESKSRGDHFTNWFHSCFLAFCFLLYCWGIGPTKLSKGKKTNNLSKALQNRSSSYKKNKNNTEIKFLKEWILTTSSIIVDLLHKGSNLGKNEIFWVKYTYPYIKWRIFHYFNYHYALIS